MSEYTDMEIGPLTKAALEEYLYPKSIEQRIGALERRIKALERRIEKIERKLNHKGGEA